MTPMQLLQRHVTGDFGDLGEEDCQLNHEAIKNGERILSAYEIGGDKLSLSVGAATDVNAEGNEHPERAAIWELNPDGSGKRLFATGLRNPVGLALHPQTGELWTTVNERDVLGSDVPPDYLARVLDGAF